MATRRAPGAIKRRNPIAVGLLKSFQRKVSVQVFWVFFFFAFARPPFPTSVRGVEMQQAGS